MGSLSKRDDVLATVLVGAIGDRVRYDHLRERWIIWNGVRWRPDLTQQMYTIIKDAILAEMSASNWDAEDQKCLASLFDSAKKESVMKALRAFPGIAMTGDEWDLDPYLIGFDNGIFDIRTQTLLDPDSTNLVSKTVGCNYNPNAEFQKKKGLLSFEEFIEDIFDGDADLVRYMWKFIGYALVGTQAEQKFWMWTGRGGNGKGVLARTLTHCFGEYAETPADTMYMRTRQGSATSNSARPDLMRLRNVRFTYMSEPPGGQFNEEMLKAHTGDDEIIARDLWKGADQMARFEPTHKIVFLTNEPPKTEDVGNSMQRRVRVVKFEKTYTPDGGRIEAHLKAQKEAILRYAVMLAGQWWQTRTLEEPPKVLAWSEQYIKDNDPIAEFIADCCVEGPNEKGSATLLWQAYEKWAPVNAEETLTRTAFGSRLGLRFDKSKKGGVVVYYGIRTKRTDEFADEVPPHVKERGTDA